MAQPKYIISYTTDDCKELDDDFIVIQINAHNDKDAEIIVGNIERYFKGVTITVEEVEDKRQKRKSVNSDRRKRA